jgi:formylglycine-generating enzyme required for sulfatase activity
MNLSRWFFLTTIVLASLAAAGTLPAEGLEWVTVGDAGNKPDKTGYGAVAYEFQISKFEITVAQYAEFLNAVAAKSDPHALWNAAQKIDRTGAPGGFSYSAQPSREREPVMHVTFLNAMRYANWLHHGGGQGDTETGAYQMAVNGGLANREAGAIVWIPNEDEWYKAAYHQPQSAGGPAENYWTYPTRSDAAPKLAAPGDTGPNLANFLADTRPQPNGAILRDYRDVMPAGSFPGSASHYGTLDQAGNAWEWIETTVFETQRVMRGGSMCGSHEKLLSRVRNSASPTKRYGDTGFRLARAVPVPEPSTIKHP